MFLTTAIRAFIVLGLALSAGACSGDPQAFNEGYESGGLLGAFIATTPEATAERKRKAQLLGAYRAKTCSAVAPAGTPAHQGCMLQIAEGGSEGRGGVRYAGKPAAGHVPAHGHHGDVPLIANRV